MTEQKTDGGSKAYFESDQRKCAFMFHYKVLFFFHSPFLVFSALI